MTNKVASFVVNYVLFGSLATYHYWGYTLQGPYSTAHLVSSAIFTAMLVANVFYTED